MVHLKRWEKRGKVRWKEGKKERGKERCKELVSGVEMKEMRQSKKLKAEKESCAWCNEKRNRNAS